MNTEWSENGERPAGRRRRLRRRGASLVVMAISLVAITGIVSLGVDFGRVQLVKMQLQSAADSAARYAASGLGNGTAVSRAIDAGNDNAADGAEVTLTAADVETGYWSYTDRTFTPGAAPANAVRVTARRTAARGNAVPLTFARVVGQPTCDVQASAIAMYIGDTDSPAGFVGIDEFQFDQNFYGDSYNSTYGPPTKKTVTEKFAGGSNGDIEFGDNADLYGDLIKGPSATLTHGKHFNVAGSEVTRGTDLPADPTEAPTVGSSGNLTLANNQTVTLSAGTYHYSSVTFGNHGKIVGTGKVTIYVSGDFVVGERFTIEAYNNVPSNMDIRLYGTGKFQSDNYWTSTANIYGPGFEVTTGNSADLRGSLVAGSIKGGNNAKFYTDTSASPAEATSGSIALVD
jgi:Flp pilus assembly protein TadG